MDLGDGESWELSTVGVTVIGVSAIAAINLAATDIDAQGRALGLVIVLDARSYENCQYNSVSDSRSLCVLTNNIDCESDDHHQGTDDQDTKEGAENYKH